MKKRKINLRQILICDFIVLILLSAVLFLVETKVTQEKMSKDLTDRLNTLQTALEKASDDTYDISYRYELRMNSTAQGLAFLYDHEDDFTVTDDLMVTFGVAGIYVGKDDFERNEDFFSYYSATASDGTEITISASKNEIEIILNSVFTENKIVEKMGNLTDLFLITDEEGNIRYCQEEGFEERNITDLGITLDDLRNREARWLKINGGWYYVSSATNEDLGSRIVCGVALEKMTVNTNIAVCTLFVIIAIIFTTIITFVYFSKQQQKRKTDTEQYSNASITRKITAFILVGMVIIGVAAVFVQSLFCLSLSSLSMVNDIKEIRSEITKAESDVELMSDFYDYHSLTSARSISYILSRHPECRNQMDLETLSDIYYLKYIMMFDTEGREYLSDSSIVGFEISDDPEDQSYDFNVLKYGVEYFVQEPRNEELTGQKRQCVGVSTYGPNGKFDGFLLTFQSPYEIELLTNKLSLNSILFNTIAASGDDAFIIDANTGIFTYNTQEELVGFKAVDYAIKEEKIRHNYFGSLSMNGTRYYVLSSQFDDQIVYVGDRTADIFKGRSQVVLITLFLSILNLALLMLVISNREVEDTVSTLDSVYVDVETPSGERKQSLNVLARFIKQRISWGDKIPEDKTAFVINVIIQILAILILFVLKFRNTLNDETSILGFIISGKWQKGFNVFALTSVVIYIIIFMLVMNVLNVFLNELIKFVNPKDETIIRLVKSFIRYFATIALIYFSLSIFGFDSTSLLASAGLLTLVVGLGAKDLVTDILAGMFIIFENEFQVGDIIELNGFKGRVIEIGIRTTKIMNTIQDVKSVNNRNLTNVVNKTRKNSYCDVIVNVPFDQDINAIEEMLKTELPKIRDECPYILEGPNYGGVDDMSGRFMRLSIRTECLEAHKFDVRAVINKRIKDLFDEHGFRLT